MSLMHSTNMKIPLCDIWGSHDYGDYEDYSFQGCVVMYFVGYELTCGEALCLNFGVAEDWRSNISATWPSSDQKRQGCV